MGLPIHIVDAFAVSPFRGNPAAVCILETERESAWMQSVAAEMNLSETAFVWPVERGFSLRWFTPMREVDLCGHATLASAHVLFELGMLEETGVAEFTTQKFGVLRATVGADTEITLNFPALACEPLELPEGLATALGASPVHAARNCFDYILELESERAVRELIPDIAALSLYDIEGFVVTARAEPDSVYTIVSRYFAPSVGIHEDPVTGAAHCGLAPYWFERAGLETLHAYQASQRGGELHVELQGETVLLRGRATTVLRGELL